MLPEPGQETSKDTGERQAAGKMPGAAGPSKFPRKVTILTFMSYLLISK